MTIVHNFHKSSKRNLSILGIFIILFVSACSSNEEMPDERLIEKELYDQAQSRLKSESYSTAIMSLEALESRFPFGRYAEQAQAELIYAYYMKGLAAFTDDSGLFSRYFQSDLEKREVVMAQTSFDELSEFISRYPQSNYVSHAKQRMIYLKNLLAKHEMYVADFYMQRGAYLAAIGRSKYVIEHLPNTPQTPYALSILVEAYDLLGYEDLKKRNLNILTSNYPDFNFQENESIKTRSWTNVLTFGLLGKEDIERPEPVTQ